MTGLRIILLILSCLLANPLTAAAQTAAPPANPEKELETVSAELQENIKDLRRNITSWQQISQDAQLPDKEKQQWREKAKAYLQECQAYGDLLAQVDPKKLPQTPGAQSFLTERRTFQRELQFFEEMLQKP